MHNFVDIMAMQCYMSGSERRGPSSLGLLPECCFHKRVTPLNLLVEGRIETPRLREEELF